MEAVQTKTENLRRQTPTPATAITPEVEGILGTIIFRTRLAKGWNGYDPKTQAMAVQTWFEILQTENIPAQYFDELYRKACNHQAFLFSQGKEPPEMSAQLMLSQWIGPNGLQKEIKQRLIDAGRTLTENAESVCRHCSGTGMREVKEDGYSGRIRCNHLD